MNDLIKQILSDKKPSLPEISETLGPSLNLLSQLSSTPQDEQWHGEGDVWRHTELVLNALYQIIEQEGAHLSHEKKGALILAAALHDIGKPLTTREREINGKVRIIAPTHEAQGAAYLFYRLLDIEMPYDLFHSIVNLVAYHHKPKLLVVKNAPKKDFFQLARSVDVELLYFLAKADMIGRSCPDKEGQVDLIEMFKLYCQDYGLWQNTDPYSEWREYISSSVDQKYQNYVFDLAVSDYEQEKIYTPYDAPPKYYSHMESHPELIYLVGPSGSGKSEWVKNYYKNYQIVSLDLLREKIGKGVSDQRVSQAALIQAKLQLKTLLAQKQKIVWDATNLRRDFRQMLFDFGKRYHAYVKMVVMHKKLKDIEEGNRSREHVVPSSVIQEQLGRFQWIEPSEAHRVVYVNNH